MVSRFALFLAVGVLLCAAHPKGAVAAEEPRQFTMGYLSIEDDPRYAERRSYARIVLRPAIDPFQGAETALKAGRIMGRAAKVRFAVERFQGKDAKDLLAGLEQLYNDAGLRFFIVDAPDEVVSELAGATKGRDLLLINVSAAGNALRSEACQAHMLHAYPSRAMLSDALAQYLTARTWRGVLLLEGPEAEDAKRAAAFVASSRKFGITVIEHRPFELSNDPRQRERNNITLLTLAGNYDTVFVADSLGEFGRYVPFQTARPRPVLGDAGLGAHAWHWAWERHGAPQLNQRFDRVAKRRMTGVDWAAWAATRALIEAVARTKSTDFEAVTGYLKSTDLSLDGYKGTPMSFRPWDGQLRQPILLAGHNAVVDRAPLEGFLHPTSYLDTLGTDAPESGCKF